MEPVNVSQWEVLSPGRDDIGTDEGGLHLLKVLFPARTKGSMCVLCGP